MSPANENMARKYSIHTYEPPFAEGVWAYFVLDPTGMIVGCPQDYFDDRAACRKAALAHQKALEAAIPAGADLYRVSEEQLTRREQERVNAAAGAVRRKVTPFNAMGVNPGAIVRGLRLASVGYALKQYTIPSLKPETVEERAQRLLGAAVS